MTTIDAAKVELELARKLFWLMAHDWIFFSTYNDDLDDWDDDGAFPAVNCNDVLVPGSSSTQLPLEEVDSYIDVCKKYSDYYPEYIWCIAKNSAKPWKHLDSLPDKEREGVAYACKLLSTKNPYEIAG